MAGKKAAKKAAKDSAKGRRPAEDAKKQKAGAEAKAAPAASRKGMKALDEAFDAEAEAHPLPEGADAVDQMLDRLPYRHRVFVLEYMANGQNATQAALAAGYSETTSASQASRLLRHGKVAAVVAAWMASELSRRKLSVANVLDELRKLAMFDPRKLYRPDGTLKAITELDDDTAAGVAGIEVKEITMDGFVIGQLKKIKHVDKGANLERLGRYLKLFTDKVEHSGILGVQLVHDVPRPERKK